MPNISHEQLKMPGLGFGVSYPIGIIGITLSMLFAKYFFKININAARADQLQMLPGVGAKLSSRIVEYRRKNGSFKTLEDLENVEGLTAKRFGRIKGLIEL